jgi:hypothetical protein
MASGAVVVASDRTASAIDRIVPGHNGFLHASGDVQDLADVIRRVVALAPHEILRITRAARVTTEEWPSERGVSIMNGLLTRAGSQDSPHECPRPLGAVVHRDG